MYHQCIFTWPGESEGYRGVCKDCKVDKEEKAEKNKESKGGKSQKEKVAAMKKVQNTSATDKCKLQQRKR